MKAQEQKTAFIRLRAEGKSLRAIAAELGVSKTTLSEWGKELSAEVQALRQDNLEELYSAYGMAREGRIRALGETLRRIDSAIEQADLSGIKPEKLLEYKLRYQAALRDEYSATAGADISGEADETLEAIRDLYRRTAAGETSIDKAKAEAALIDKIITGYTRSQPLEELFRM